MISSTITPETVRKLLERGVLPGADFSATDISSISIPNEVSVLSKDALHIIERKQDVDWLQFDRLRVHYERGRTNGYIDYVQCFSIPSRVVVPLPPVSSIASGMRSNVEITFSYDKRSHQYTVNDFVAHFNQRYALLERILRTWPELQMPLSIRRIYNKQDKEHVAIIGMVSDKQDTKNGNLRITLEDPTGSIDVIINKGKPDLFAEAQDIVLDEVIGVVGVCGSRIVFANNIIWPDVPFTNDLKKASDDVYAVFLSDTHVGSRYFLHEEFTRFLRWIGGETGTSEQREIAERVRYVFIAGDLVDGVGIYPGQDSELVIKDIYAQYNEFARLIKQIPSHIRIILCPGNHDALRLSEPQPPLDPDFARSVYELPNVTIVSNPAIVTIHSSPEFAGIDILLYHGYSFDHYVANVDSIRNKGGYHRADLIMKFLLRRRHLSPTQGSTLRLPNADTDPLVLTRLPDVFLTGHIHYSLVAQYRNITLVSGSCWQSTTSFQEKMGHNPEPARAPVINLKTRKAKILKFI